MSGAVCQPMPGRLSTWRVLAADGIEITLGFIRLADGMWIARTMGSEKSAACLRRFSVEDKAAAVLWLQEREPAPAEPGRSPYAAPGRRRDA